MINEKNENKINELMKPFEGKKLSVRLISDGLSINITGTINYMYGTQYEMSGSCFHMVFSIFNIEDIIDSGGEPHVEIETCNQTLNIY